MAAEFLTKDQLRQQRVRKIENSANGVADYYSELGPTFGRALFLVCITVWGSSPVITLARLNNNVKPHIIDAWKYRADIAGVLLKKHQFEFTAIYLQTPNLAFKLTDKADLWIDFREVRKELEL